MSESKDQTDAGSTVFHLRYYCGYYSRCYIFGSTLWGDSNKWEWFLISNPIAIGSILLLGGYFTGRLIHGISGCSIDSLLHAERNWLRECVVTAIQLSSFSLALSLIDETIKLYRNLILTNKEFTA